MATVVDIWNKYEKNLLNKLDSIIDKVENFADEQTSGTTPSLLPIQKVSGNLNKSLKKERTSKYTWEITWGEAYAKYAIYKKGKTPRGLLGDGGRLETKFYNYLKSL